jgi:hypothetical protein
VLIGLDLALCRLRIQLLELFLLTLKSDFITLELGLRCLHIRNHTHDAVLHIRQIVNLRQKIRQLCILEETRKHVLLVALIEEEDKPSDGLPLSTDIGPLLTYLLLHRTNFDHRLIYLRLSGIDLSLHNRNLILENRYFFLERIRLTARRCYDGALCGSLLFQRVNLGL